MDALEIKVKDTFGTDPGHVTNEQIYLALLELVKEEAEKKVKGFMRVEGPTLVEAHFSDEQKEEVKPPNVPPTLQVKLL